MLGLADLVNLCVNRVQKVSCKPHVVCEENWLTGYYTILIIYADDIVVIGNEVVEVERLEKHLSAEFELMILVSLRYILGIEIARSQGTREIYVRSIGRNYY